jgi:uncharacterized membrane protein YtjA (UPF0391 family)
MVKLVFIFLILAIVSALFAFTNIATAVPAIAEVLFYTSLALFIITLVWWLLSRHKMRSNEL